MSLPRPLVALLSVENLVSPPSVSVLAPASPMRSIPRTRPGRRTKVTVSGPAGTVRSADGKTITLPTPDPVGSTFETAPIILTVKNQGNITVHAVKISMGESHNTSSSASNALAAETNVCIQSQDYSGGPWTEGNGPLSAAVALGVVQNPTILHPRRHAHVLGVLLRRAELVPLPSHPQRRLQHQHRVERVPRWRLHDAGRADG